MPASGCRDSSAVSVHVIRIGSNVGWCLAIALEGYVPSAARDPLASGNSPRSPRTLVTRRSKLLGIRTRGDPGRFLPNPCDR